MCAIGGGRAYAQPVAPTAAGVARDHYVHTIATGDTLIALANQLMVDRRGWPAIARLNGVREPRRLRPGRPLLFPIGLLRGLPGQAEVLWVRGQPRIESAGAAIVALLGAAIAPGATIATGDGEAVRLRLSTGCDVTVGERTRLTLVELRTIAGTVGRTLIEVPRGRAELTVAPATHPQQRHEVKTPIVNTTVRGTEFRVGVSDDATTITEVTDGIVVVRRDAQMADVASGFGVRVGPGDTTVLPTPLLPPPNLSSLTLTTTRVPVRAQWMAQPGETAYRVRVLPAGGGAPLLDQRVSGPDASLPDLDDAAYVLAVRAIDERGLEGRDATHPFDVHARPLPPLVRDASADPTYGDALTLRWTQPESVTGVDVQVAGDVTFEAPTFERCCIATTEIDVPLAPGRYAWRVASRQGDHRGPWGDAVTNELRARPAAGPPASARVLKKELTLQWSAGMTGDRYAIQVSTDPSFATTLIDTVVVEPALTMPRPPAGRYHVRIRHVNAEGIDGPYGPTQILDVVRPPRSKWWWLLVPAGAAGVLVGVR